LEERKLDRGVEGVHKSSQHANRVISAAKEKKQKECASDLSDIKTDE